jgi:predicted SAM-dependent methyltransferase
MHFSAPSLKTGLYNLVNQVISKAGLLLIRKRQLGETKSLVEDYGLLQQDILRVKDCSSGGLRRHLIETNRTKWLEIGCGGNLHDENFHCLDVFPEGIIDRALRGKYTRLDIAQARRQDLENLGRFDFIRMQHVFEHFSPEQGRNVVENCALLLNPGGYLLITTPDLRVHARAYLKGEYKNNKRMDSFNSWAWRRIAEDAPDSFYFSIFAHSMPYESHLWCYDFEGLSYVLRQTNSFDEIEELGWEHPFASFPFTHNRPHEDVCVLARRKA